MNLPSTSYSPGRGHSRTRRSLFFPLKGKKAARGAWLLLEVVVALSVFSMAVVSFVIALNQTAEVSLHAQHKSLVWRLIEGAVMEAMTEPELTANEYSYDIQDEMDMQIIVAVSPLELTTKDETQLSDMWLINVKAIWIYEGEEQSEEVEVWRYGKMYQP